MPPPAGTSRVRVCVRMRPMNASERRSPAGNAPVVACADPTTLEVMTPGVGEDAPPTLRAFRYDLCCHDGFSQVLARRKTRGPDCRRRRVLCRSIETRGSPSPRAFSLMKPSEARAPSLRRRSLTLASGCGGGPGRGGARRWMHARNEYVSSGRLLPALRRAAADRRGARRDAGWAPLRASPVVAASGDVVF